MKHLAIFSLAAALALTGCNQYSTPSVDSRRTAAGPDSARPDGVNARSIDPVNTQSDPNTTTGSVGGSPAGTSSAQTAPSSSNGVR